jgi:hypothetical protein
MKSKSELRARKKGIRQKARVHRRAKKEKVADKYKGLTLRQIQYRKNRLLGMNRMDAGISAGYSESYMRHRSKVVEDVVKSSIIDELNRAGATDKVLARELTNLALNAVKIQSCNVLIQKDAKEEFKVNKSANDFIEVPDLHLRKDSIELIAKLKKHLVPTPLVDNSEHTHLTIIIEGKPSEQRDPDQVHPETSISIRDPQ